MNIGSRLEFIKHLFLEILKDRTELFELKPLIKKAETIEEINKILIDKKITPLEKDIELVKMIAKKNIQNNRSIGIKSKIILISIIDKNQPIKDIVIEILNLIKTNDLNK